MEKTLPQVASRRLIWPGMTVFVIARLRGAGVARTLLGVEFGGILPRDRWSASNGLPDRLRQRGGQSARIGRRLVELTDRMVHGWHRLRDGPMTRVEFRWTMRAVHREVRALLRRGLCCAVAPTAGTSRDILKKPAGALGTFVDRQGVEPTKTWAERALCFAVLGRKGSLGTRGCSADLRRLGGFRISD